MISGLMDGDNYSILFDDDGNGCLVIFFGGFIDQDFIFFVLEYLEVCEGSFVLFLIVLFGGGDFDFVVLFGDGVFIDLSSGEVFDVLGSYEIIYIINDGCVFVSSIYIFIVMLLLLLFSVDFFYEFCVDENVMVFLSGDNEDFFFLY